jgi:hypothetical protein
LVGSWWSSTYWPALGWEESPTSAPVRRAVTPTLRGLGSTTPAEKPAEAYQPTSLFTPQAQSAYGDDQYADTGENIQLGAIHEGID